MYIYICLYIGLYIYIEYIFGFNGLVLDNLLSESCGDSKSPPPGATHLGRSEHFGPLLPAFCDSLGILKGMVVSNPWGYPSAIFDWDFPWNTPNPAMGVIGHWNNAHLDANLILKEK